MNEAPLFDRAAHEVKAAEVLDALHAAEAEYENATAALEEAEDYYEEIDLGEPSAAAKRLTARESVDIARELVTKAHSKVRRAKRLADEYNVDDRLAIALLPMLARLSGNHPGFDLVAVPGELTSTPQRPTLVITQQQRAELDDSGILSSGDPGRNDYRPLKLAYWHDKGLHRDLIPDGEAILAAASSVGVGIVQRATELHFRETEKDGFTVRTVTFHARALDPVLPVVADLKPAEWFGKSVVSRLTDAVMADGLQVAKGPAKLVSSEASKGERTAIIEMPLDIVDRFGRSAGEERIGHLLGQHWSQSLVPGLGRCAAVETGLSRGTATMVRFTFVSATPARVAA